MLCMSYLSWKFLTSCQAQRNTFWTTKVKRKSDPHCTVKFYWWVFGSKKINILGQFCTFSQLFLPPYKFYFSTILKVWTYVISYFIFKLFSWLMVCSLNYFWCCFENYCCAGFTTICCFLAESSNFGFSLLFL